MQTASKLYLVLDFVNGGHLFFQLYRQGIFDEDLARLYTAEMVLAIVHLHTLGIAHRDLKPVSHSSVGDWCQRHVLLALLTGRHYYLSCISSSDSGCVFCIPHWCETPCPLGFQSLMHCSVRQAWAMCIWITVAELLSWKACGLMGAGECTSG